LLGGVIYREEAMSDMRELRKQLMALDDDFADDVLLDKTAAFVQAQVDAARVAAIAEERETQLLCGHPARMGYIRDGRMTVPGPVINCALCDKLAAERAVDAAVKAERARVAEVAG
jgi:hypothetical protein